MRQLLLGSIAAGTLALVIGCGTKSTPTPATAAASNTTTESKKNSDEKTPAPTLEARIEANWDSKLKNCMEPASAEAKTGTQPSANCAVAGRVRLFLGEKDKPQEVDGVLTVELFDCSPESGLAEPLRIQSWDFEGAMLKYFHTENVADPEYTFVLPWGTYQKEITQVRIDVTYKPKTGTALTTKGAILTLDHSEIKELIEK